MFRVCSCESLKHYHRLLFTVQVLNVYRTYFPDPPGGLQEAIRQTCYATSSLDVNNVIYTLSPNHDPKLISFPEAKVMRERSWIAPASCDIGGLTAFKTYRHLVQQSDLIHCYHPWPFADLLSLSYPSRKPMLLTYISDVVRQKLLGSLYAPLMWRTLNQVNIIVANCPSYVETSPVLSEKKIRDKVRVIPLGINEYGYPQSMDDKVFDRININSNEPYFLFLGVLRYYKGLHTLIEAARNLNAKVLIAGSGPEESNLKKQVELLGLKNIIFAGQVTNQEKVSLIKNCTALVLPSHLRSEAFGMVLVEASMFGKPMISCEIGTGTSYVNLHGETGLVVKPASSYELHNAMRDMLGDQSEVQTFGKNARARYESLFSGEALGRAYKAVYDELLS